MLRWICSGCNWETTIPPTDTVWGCCTEAASANSGATHITVTRIDCKNERDTVIDELLPASHLPFQIVGDRHHFIRRLNRLRVNFIAALRDNHVDHFLGAVHVGTFQKALLDRSKSGRKTAGPLQRRAGGETVEKQIVSHRNQPGRVI